MVNLLLTNTSLSGLWYHMMNIWNEHVERATSIFPEHVQQATSVFPLLYLQAM